MSTTLLTEHEILALKKDLPQWKMRDGQLIREWTFPDFAQAIQFINRVADAAQRANHHPDIDIRYNRVILALFSHDAWGLTSRDPAMARELDRLLP